MIKAIDCAKVIEKALATDSNAFNTLQNSITTLDNITIDNIIAAISKIDQLPASISPNSLQRSSKRNVYSVVTMNMFRLLNGTFKWISPGIPTSIDKVLNDTMLTSDNSDHKTLCYCKPNEGFFAIDGTTKCPLCGGVSNFTSTTTRLALAQALLEETMVRDTNKRSSRNITRHYKRRSSKALLNNNHILRDITNLTNRSPIRLETARPSDAELNNITQPNHMISNFVLSYFFKILAKRFENILYEDFLFDLVKSEGSWKQFVDTNLCRSHYSNFFNKLSNRDLICLIPICHQAHWTLVVRRFTGNSWKIFFLDSISQGSNQRFTEWRTLFDDDTFFTGEWVIAKIFQQSELECGARVGLHGVCFTLSKKRSGDIINDLARFKDLSVRGRLMVSSICRDGYWSHQKWLSRIIGSEETPNAKQSTLGV